MTDQNKCSKCESEMEEGLLVDEYKGKSGWLKELNSQFDLKNLKLLTTYRCTSCGFLESYAK